jgi:ankyrin repeat protein
MPLTPQELNSKLEGIFWVAKLKKEDFSQENLKAICAPNLYCNLHRIIKAQAFNKIPIEILSQEFLLNTKDLHGRNSYHLAVMQDQLQEIPASWLNKESLASADENGNTVLHTTAINAELNEIPSDILLENPELLDLENTSKQTVLHMAALYGCIDQIPEKLITTERLAKKDENNLNVVQKLAGIGNLEQLPVKFFQDPIMVETTNQNESPFQLCINISTLHQIPICEITKNKEFEKILYQTENKYNLKSINEWINTAINFTKIKKEPQKILEIFPQIQNLKEINMRCNTFHELDLQFYQNLTQEYIKIKLKTKTLKKD